MTETGWSAIVWGRTFDADHWWRAVPETVDVEQLRDLVESATVAPGIELDEPRYLLARRHGHWFTGVACNARDLSDSMWKDLKGRTLSVFVGWAGPLDAALPPEWTDLAANYVRWAGPVYRRWMGEDWNRPSAELRRPHATTPDRAPWPQPAGPPTTGGRSTASELATRPGVVELYPDVDQDRVWAAGLHSVDPFVLVTGWPRRRNIPLAYLTHASVAGIEDAADVVVDGGLDLESERAELLGKEASMPEPDEYRPAPATRRSGWLWPRSRDVEQLAADLAEVSDRLAAAEREIEKLRAAVAARHDLPAAQE